jgi:DNA segregation ATPase FtsK/SpoIIIE, S-DNA-T family
MTTTDESAPVAEQVNGHVVDPSTRPVIITRPDLTGPDLDELTLPTVVRSPWSVAVPVNDDPDDDADPIVVDDAPAAPRRSARVRIRTVIVHPHSKAVARHGAYVLLGGKVAVRRGWDSRSTARHERLMRAAEAAGDHAAAQTWEQRAEHFRQARHTRRMALLAAPVIAAKSLVYGAAGLLALGIMLAISSKRASDVMRPLQDISEAVRYTLALAGEVWGPVSTAAPWLALVALWAVGRSHARTSSGWVSRLQPDGGDLGVIVTADGIVRALQHLGIAKLDKAFKAGWMPVFITSPVKDGRGYSATFELPMGVTPAMLADRREVFARNLHRAPIEVWVTDAVQADTGRAGVVDLWVADSGALNRAAPPYPYLDEGTCDVFVGVPAGVSPRGDTITIPIVGNNGVAGGIMGQGKSNACRDVFLGCALDPLAELRVYVFAGNGDFDAYRPRLSRYERGADDATALAGLDSLTELYAEVGRRETRLAGIGAKKVTREIAEKHPDLRPIVVLYSECHELFGHRDKKGIGEPAAEWAVQTMRRARKTAITLFFDTQSSRKEAIPPKIVELCSVNICFAVKSWRSNDGFLKDGAFAAGIRATELRPGADRGTSLVTGVSDEKFELLKWHFIEVDDDTGFDAAADVIARAVADIRPGTPIEATAPVRVIERRDLLDDLDDVLDTAPVPAADLPALLRGLSSTWGPYLKLTGKALVEQLAALGVKVPSTGNRWPVDPVAVRTALARRSTADLDDE